MGSAKRTDFRAIKARRSAALMRPELRLEAKAAPVAEAEIAAAVAAGRFTKLPTQKRR
jgi:hypothetical protein